MDTEKILKSLEESGLNGIEHIDYKDKNIFVVKFNFDFDDSEIESARAYANDECDEEEESEEWYDDFFLPYLNDLAVDNVGEIIEDIMADFDIDGQFVTSDLNDEEYENDECIAAFSDEEGKFELEDILDELEL